jgi:hypothetical protein
MDAVSAAVREGVGVDAIRAFGAPAMTDFLAPDFERYRFRPIVGNRFLPDPALDRLPAAPLRSGRPGARGGRHLGPDGGGPGELEEKISLSTKATYQRDVRLPIAVRAQMTA